MSFLINASEEDIKSGAAFQNYQRYLGSIKSQLPQSVYDFATADWHYDPSQRTCPHDSWIEKIEISELAEGLRHEVRKTRIGLFLLGAYHDRILSLIYDDVVAYNISALRSTGGHGDWLIDEINLSETNMVVHEIAFSSGAVFRFECRDLHFNEEKLPQGKMAIPPGGLLPP